jgi:steroid 5-alpha reductase family enzyme
MGPIRYIFPAFVAAMWVLCGLGIASGQWSGIHWAMLGTAHLACAIIFSNFVYVFSYGYGISMALVNLLVMAWRPVPAVLLAGGLGVAYGIRLVWFVYARYQSQGYAPTRNRGEVADASVPLPLRLFMWISCGWLMAFVAMPVWLAATATSGRITAGLAAGASLMLAGLLLEAIADQQKQVAKAANPGQFVMTGLYARLRHPNYLGEIIFQIGLVVVAAVSAAGPWALAVGVAGPSYIVILMYFAAHDQDAQQRRRYGDDPEFQAHQRRSSSLLPGF